MGRCSYGHGRRFLVSLRIPPAPPPLSPACCSHIPFSSARDARRYWTAGAITAIHAAGKPHQGWWAPTLQALARELEPQSGSLRATQRRPAKPAALGRRHTHYSAWPNRPSSGPLMRAHFEWPRLEASIEVNPEFLPRLGAGHAAAGVKRNQLRHPGTPIPPVQAARQRLWPVISPAPGDGLDCGEAGSKSGDVDLICRPLPLQRTPERFAPRSP